MASLTAGTGVWVYAICADIDDGRLSGVVGVDREPVRAVRAAGLTAVVGSVPLTEFGEEGLPRNLNDLARLESIARAHHRVVEIVADHGPAVPTRLATVYQDTDRIAGMLARRHDDFIAALGRVARRREWGVKVYGDRPEPATAVTPPLGASPGSPGAGTAYLRDRRQQLADRDVSHRTALAAAEAVHADLSGHAVAARRHRPQDPQLRGESRWMVLNGAYLVDDDIAEAFAAAVAACADRYRDVTIESTGPWPPYSFADIEDDADLTQGPP